MVQGYVCVGRPQGAGLISRPLIGHLEPVKASHWLLMTEGQTVTADDPIIWFLSLSNSPSHPHPCAGHIIISSYLCFRGNFLTLAWYHQRGSVAQIRGLCEKISLSQLSILTFYSDNLVHHQHNIPEMKNDHCWNLVHVHTLDMPEFLFVWDLIWEISISKYKLHCSVARIYIWVRWSRGQPIRGQYCGHLTGIDQSEASEYAWADGRVMTRMLSDCEEKFPMKWEPENWDAIILVSVTGLPWPWDGKQIAVTTEWECAIQISRLHLGVCWISMRIFSVINSPN